MSKKKKNGIGWFTNLVDKFKEARQNWLRRNIIKKIAKLTPVGPEIDMDRFMAPGGGQWTEKEAAHCGRFHEHIQMHGKVVEESHPFEQKCEHGTIAKGAKYPKKIQYNDGSFTEIEILGNEECQKAFKELMQRQMFPDTQWVVCPHCKKQSE